ncbi:hypothetical protein THAOC_19090, partial [Thalassiosira oceanica]
APKKKTVAQEEDRDQEEGCHQEEDRRQEVNSSASSIICAHAKLLDFPVLKSAYHIGQNVVTDTTVACASFTPPSASADIDSYDCLLVHVRPTGLPLISF